MEIGRPIIAYAVIRFYPCLMYIYILYEWLPFERIPVTCNYLPIRCQNEGVYQYAVWFEPPTDSRGMRRKLLDEHSDTVGSVKAFDGTILFLPIELPQQVSRHRPVIRDCLLDSIVRHQIF